MGRGGTVAPGVVVVVLAAAATSVVSLEMVRRRWLADAEGLSLGRRWQERHGDEPVVSNRAPELQSGLHGLSALFGVWSTPSAAGSWGDVHVIT